MSKSVYVCQRDGLAVYLWRGGVWKHAAGPNVRSCRRPPVVVERAAFEAMLAGAAADAAAAIRDHRQS